MSSTHAQIAEPTALATARPQDGTGVMSVGVARRGGVAVRSAVVPCVLPVCRMDVAGSTPTASSPAWTTISSFRSRQRKPLTCDGTLPLPLHGRSDIHGRTDIGGGLHDRIEVRPA